MQGPKRRKQGGSCRSQSIRPEYLDARTNSDRHYRWGSVSQSISPEYLDARSGVLYLYLPAGGLNQSGLSTWMQEGQRSLTQQTLHSLNQSGLSTWMQEHPLHLLVRRRVSQSIRPEYLDASREDNFFGSSGVSINQA